jgi:hypothetical protein
MLTLKYGYSIANILYIIIWTMEILQTETGRQTNTNFLSIIDIEDYL